MRRPVKAKRSRTATRRSLSVLENPGPDDEMGHHGGPSEQAQDVLRQDGHHGSDNSVNSNGEEDKHEDEDEERARKDTK